MSITCANNQVIKISRSEDETHFWAVAFGKTLKAGDVVALDGDLGAGKTAICKGICEGLGFTGGVNSPSYSIVHEYPNNPPVYHLDLYRLSSAQDLLDIGIEVFTFSKGVTLIEWASAAGDFPLNITHRITMKILGENEREIILSQQEETGNSNVNKIFISLGSNIEPRSKHLAQARELLKADCRAALCLDCKDADAYQSAGSINWQESPIYETEAWGYADQAKFLNQVVSFNSNKTPQELLKLCKEIEKRLGRQQREKWHEREIDLDLLYCGDIVLKTKNLILPHPLISQREFVLRPLSDLDPSFHDPATQLTAKEMLYEIVGKT